MSDTDNFEPPTESSGDQIHKLVRGGLGMIPFASQAAIELFETVVAPPLQQRQGEWMKSIADGLRQLEEKQKCVVDELKDHPEFIDTLLHASQAAMRTNQEKKRDALRNAVLNAALPSPPEISWQQIFIGLADSFTDWHIQILDLLNDPPKWFDRNEKELPNLGSESSLAPMLFAAYPELNGQQELYERIVRELYDEKLTTLESFHMSPSGSGVFQRRVTDLGQRFLGFITSPC